MDFDLIIGGISIFLGIVAGIAVQVGADRWRDSRDKKKRQENLRFELMLNCRLIKTWQDSLDGLKTAIGGATLNSYFQYLDLSRALFVTANDMLRQGSLYETLGDEQIEALQFAAKELSIAGEDTWNRQVAEWKERFNVQLLARDSNALQELKERASAKVDFWKSRLNEHEKRMQDIAAKL
jgi:hypothetical protein